MDQVGGLVATWLLNDPPPTSIAVVPDANGTYAVTITF